MISDNILPGKGSVDGNLCNKAAQTKVKAQTTLAIKLKSQLIVTEALYFGMVFTFSIFTK